MPRRNKAQDQTAHALRRAYERYGLKLSTHHLANIIRAIQEGRARLVAQQSLRVFVFDVSINVRTAFVGWDGPDTTTMRVVYDKQRRTIATFLLPGMGE